MSDSIAQEFQDLQAEQSIADLISALKEAQDKPNAFAAAACSDAVLSMERFIKRFSNADAACVETCCSVFSVALFNSMTDYQAAIQYDD